MWLGPTQIRDSFAEAFGMRYARLVVTGHDREWVESAASAATGFATSVIGCDVEAAVERWLDPSATPDGRPGVSLLFFGFSNDGLAKSLAARTGQCLLTCATTSVFDGLPDAETRAPLGSFLRYFGDGFQKSKVVGGRRYWRIPVMDGEFLVTESVGIEKGVAGGNIILECVDPLVALAAARRVLDALRDFPGVILPFPGGVVRSGSKVGSLRYRKLKATTNEAYCPTLAGRVPTRLDPRASCAYEMVIDGTDEASVVQAMAIAVRVAVGEGVVAIDAGNYGGKLGKYHFHLRRILESVPA